MTEYEVTLEQSNESKPEPPINIPLTVGKVELSGGTTFDFGKRIVIARGLIGSSEVSSTLETYPDDQYVARPSQQWNEIALSGLSALWEKAKDFFAVATQTIDQVAGGIINLVARSGMTVTGGLNLIFRPASNSFADKAADSIFKVTGVTWTPVSNNLQSYSNRASRAVADSSFVIGGMYALQPYTQTVSNATLVITYTSNAANGKEQSRFGLYRWNASENNWRPLNAIHDSQSRAMTATINQLGTFAVAYDITPPTVSVEVSNTARTISTPVPLVHAIISDMGVGVDATTVQMRIDGTVVPARYFTMTGDLMIVPVGYEMSVPHSIEISVRDTAGNSAIRRLVLSPVTGKTLYEDYKIFLPSVMRS